MADDLMQVLEAFDEFEVKTDKAVSSLKYEYQNMKAGRANPHILDKILVDYYGTQTPINQMGNISVPEARMIVVSVWDQKALKDVEKAIIAANIGITPNNDGKVLRLIFPELTEERRKALVKDIKSISENCKVAIRNARRDINDVFKKLKNDKLISEDELAANEREVDKKTSQIIETVEKITKEKETEVLSV